MTPSEYRAKAALLLERAQTVGGNKTEAMKLALSYLRLADLAEKNTKTDLVYETPAAPETRAMPLRQSITQPMQQQQQKTKDDE
jgi:hypothetical protein